MGLGVLPLAVVVVRCGDLNGFGATLPANGDTNGDGPRGVGVAGEFSRARKGGRKKLLVGANVFASADAKAAAAEENDEGACGACMGAGWSAESSFQISSIFSLAF